MYTSHKVVLFLVISLMILSDFGETRYTRRSSEDGNNDMKRENEITRVVNATTESRAMERQRRSTDDDWKFYCFTFTNYCLRRSCKEVLHRRGVRSIAFRGCMRCHMSYCAGQSAPF